jgi:hypothetical protein
MILSSNALKSSRAGSGKFRTVISFFQLDGYFQNGGHQQDRFEAVL